MKINYIYLDGYKNLNKLELEFEDDSCVNALIGNNGSGKSNILEALTIIFTALYNDQPVKFTYEIQYIIEDHLIVISNKKEEQFLCDGKKVKKSDKIRMLPRSIFLYYCGETDRLKGLSLAYTDKKVASHLKKIEVHFDNHDGLLSRLDLRGMRADEAIEYVDKNLDKANLRGLNQVTIIHGYGTGALKKAVKEYLDNSPYVAKYRYGDETEGRDGVVVVDLI